jgi:uncharacterized UPF0160 family protein
MKKQIYKPGTLVRLSLGKSNRLFNKYHDDHKKWTGVTDGGKYLINNRSTGMILKYFDARYDEGVDTSVYIVLIDTFKVCVHESWLELLCP